MKYDKATSKLDSVTICFKACEALLGRVILREELRMADRQTLDFCTTALHTALAIQWSFGFDAYCGRRDSYVEWKSET